MKTHAKWYLEAKEIYIVPDLFWGGSQIMIWRLISNEYLALSYVCLTLIM